jgi:hypothetical protein
MSNRYSYIPKQGSLNTLKSIQKNDYLKSEFGYNLTQSLPLTSSIASEFLSESLEYTRDRRHIYSLKNTLNYYNYLSKHYSYSSSYGDKNTQNINLVNIPSIFYGSSIDKGTVSLSYYITGTLIAKLEDKNKNGELIQTFGVNGSGSVAGVVLYNEGFLLLTGSWNLHNSHSEIYDYNNTNQTLLPKWIFWGAGLGQETNLTTASSFDLAYDGVNYISVLTMFAHAEKGEFNHSNNPTYIKYGETLTHSVIANYNEYAEYPKMQIKNTTKYAYEDYTGSLEKQTYITKIGIYDENKNLIAIAKLAKPVRKPENRDLTFKFKLDI